MATQGVQPGAGGDPGVLGDGQEPLGDFPLSGTNLSENFSMVRLCFV